MNNINKVKKQLIIEDDDDDFEVIESKVCKQSVSTKKKNRGTGAGGANTNVNGLSYEDNTDLKVCYCEIEENKENNSKKIKFEGNTREFINVKKAAFHKYMDEIGEKNNSLQLAAGCKQPDEVYIDLERKIIFIIEKKFQQSPGSVDEKLQTAPYKKHFYEKLFQNYKINYIYCLSDWFKLDTYKGLLEYLEENSIPVFWGNDLDYKNKIIKFICD
jgi:hypothetical protein